MTKYYQRARRQPKDGARIVSLDAAEGRAAREPMDPGEYGELERWQNLHEAVLKLPVIDREAFVLIFYSGWHIRDVAGLFGIGERQARRRWQSACFKLKELLGDNTPAIYTSCGQQ